MPSGRTLESYLRKLNEYLGQFPYEQSTYFEQLIGFTFSQVLSLPFYEVGSDDPQVEQRVVWQGSSAGGRLSRAPSTSRNPDIVAYCCGFHLVIEATQKTGASQWSQEFAQAVRHCDDFVSANGLDPSAVCIVLVTPEIHEDTYRSLRHGPRTKYPFVPLEIATLSAMVRTSILAFTMRNLDLRGLLNEISKYVTRSVTVQEFRTGLEDKVLGWQKDVMRREKGAFIGVKAYEAMKRIRRPAVAVSEIFESLIRHPFVGQYLKIIGEKVNVAEIETILVEQSLGCCAGRTLQTGECLIERVPAVDFKHRGSILIRVVDEISRRAD